MEYIVETIKKALRALEKGYMRADIHNIFELGINAQKAWEKHRKKPHRIAIAKTHSVPIKKQRKRLIATYSESVIRRIPYALHVKNDTI